MRDYRETFESGEAPAYHVTCKFCQVDLYGRTGPHKPGCPRFDRRDGGSMNEQERKAPEVARRVDLERLREATGYGRTELYGDELAVLLAVVDAAREVYADGRGVARLRSALEPFTPAEEEEFTVRPLGAGLAAAAWRNVPIVGSNLVFNERMQETDRQRRLAALGIQVVDPPVSDAVSSAAGGRSVSRPGAENGPQSLSRPALLDREHVRRDAEWWISTDAAYEDRSRSVSDRLACHCLALLAELEQAERALDLERAQHSDDVDDLEARLARVPALVEALKRIEDQYEPNTATACNEIARTALAEWEQA